MRRVAVQDESDHVPIGVRAVEPAQERREVRVPVRVADLRDRHAVGEVGRRQQRERAEPDVLVVALVGGGPALGVAAGDGRAVLAGGRDASKERLVEDARFSVGNFGRKLTVSLREG